MIKNQLDKMITVSQLSEYIYCPLKVYLNHSDNSYTNNDSMITGKITHDAVRGFEELIKRNLWHLNGKMTIKNILESILKDVPEFLDNIYHIYQDELVDRNIDKIFGILEDYLKFESRLTSIKAHKILKTGLKGIEVVEMLFPPCLIEFRMENRELGLKGTVEKIEIIDGNYYPIELKTSLPPLNGVWQSDAIQMTAYAVLMEHEFNREVPVGFINYMRVGSRKTILVNSILREKFLKVHEELRSMLYDSLIPEFIPSVNKCRSCEYSELCEYNI